METKFVFAHQLVEANGKTIRENNLELTHRIPIGALVEIKSTDDEEWEWAGIRLYVCEHQRDCDGTPLYTLGKKGGQEEIVKGDPWSYKNLSSGFSEDNLTAIKKDDPC